MLQATYYGTATVRLRLPGGTVLLTDPAFDRFGRPFAAEAGCTVGTKDVAELGPGAAYANESHADRRKGYSASN